MGLVRYIVGTGLQVTGEIVKSDTLGDYITEYCGDLIKSKAKEFSFAVLRTKEEKALKKLMNVTGENFGEIEEALSKEISNIPDIIAEIADHISYIKVSLGESFVIPNFMIQQISETRIQNIILNSADFQSAYPDESHRKAVIGAHIKDAVNDIINEATKSGILVRKLNRYQIISGNLEYNFSNTLTDIQRGYCSVLSIYADQNVSRNDRVGHQKGIKARLGRLSLVEKNKYVGAWQRLLSLIDKGIDANNIYRTLQSENLNPVIKFSEN